MNEMHFYLFSIWNVCLYVLLLLNIKYLFICLHAFCIWAIINMWMVLFVKLTQNVWAMRIHHRASGHVGRRWQSNSEMTFHHTTHFGIANISISQNTRITIYYRRRRDHSPKRAIMQITRTRMSTRKAESHETKKKYKPHESKKKLKRNNVNVIWWRVSHEYLKNFIKQMCVCVFNRYLGHADNNTRQCLYTMLCIRRYMFLFLLKMNLKKKIQKKKKMCEIINHPNVTE